MFNFLFKSLIGAINMFSFDSRKSAFIGFATVAVFTVCTLAAMILFPDYSFFGQFISELALLPLPGMFLNVGLVVSGILFLVFSLSLWNQEFSLSGKAGLLFAALAGLAMIGAGVFPIGVKPHHGFFAVMLFLFLLLAVLAISFSLWKNKLFPKWFSLLGLAFAIIEIICFANGFGPACQKLVVCSYLLWLMVFSFILWKHETIK